MVYHDISQEQLLLLITQAVQAELQKRSRQVPVGISVRHIHLTRDDVDKLFGYGYQLTPKKALSQPGQFACEECLDIIGPKGELKHVRILGPERSATQIELAQTELPQHRHQSAGAFQRGYKGHAGRDPARPARYFDRAGGRDDRRPPHPHDSRTGSGLRPCRRRPRAGKDRRPQAGRDGRGADPRKRQMCTGFSHRHG